MKAVILAGGFGTRLKSVVNNVPKPMALVGGKPFLEHTIRFLHDAGITDIILTVHHLKNTIKSYFGDGQRWHVRITYAEEAVPLGTAGAIKNAAEFLKEEDGRIDDFLVLNGDTFANVNIDELVDSHRRLGGVATVAISKSSDAQHYGGVKLEGDRVGGFLKNEASSNEVDINAGMYVCSPALLDRIPIGRSVSLENEIFPKLVEDHVLFGWRFSGYFMDMGRPETLAKFKSDYLDAIKLSEDHSVEDAMRRISKTGIDFCVVTSNEGKLLGVLNDRLVKKYLLSGGGIHDSVSKAMVTDPEVASVAESDASRKARMRRGLRHLPIVDDLGRFHDLEFRASKLKVESFPTVRGRAPLRISFAGGGTDLEHFFNEHGGIVISSTIDKYVYASLSKRADSKVRIVSDLGKEILVDSIESLKYGEWYDLVKATVNLVDPDFGFDLYLHNDVPPGRGLGSSASFSVLLVKMFGELMGAHFSDERVAELAFKVEESELNIKGGWQDQYAAVTGGFNYMEFSRENRLVHPLRIKEEVAQELNEHMLLCYVGNAHDSSIQQSSAVDQFKRDESIITRAHLEHKELAVKIKGALLKNELEDIGGLLAKSWEMKKKLSPVMSSPMIDGLYTTGLKNGAYGGRLLGSGGGGYLLFFHAPNKRNDLATALTSKGAEVMNFNFDFSGVKVWPVKGKS